jgi:hypothetical protein
VTTTAFPSARSARGRVLRLMSSVRRPMTGGEVIAYALTSWPATEVRSLMDGMADDGLVTFTEAYHPNARGRRSRVYRLADAVAAARGPELAEGGAA